MPLLHCPTCEKQMVVRTQSRDEGSRVVYVDSCSLCRTVLHEDTYVKHPPANPALR